MISGLGKTFGLQARQWKQALDNAFSAIKARWEQAFELVRKDIGGSDFPTGDKKYLFSCLNSYTSVYKICSGLRTTPKDKWLHSKIRKRLGNNPKSKSLTFSVDEYMYDHYIDDKDNHWLGIMILTPYKRMRIPLTGKPEKITGTLKIKLFPKLIEIHQPIEVIPEPQKTGPIVAVDKGYKALLHSSSEKKYGTELGELLTKESDRLSLKNKHRNRLRAITKNSPNTPESKHINKYNLGKKKYLNQKQVNKNLIYDYINKAIQDFLDSENPNTLISEKLNPQSSWNHLLDRRTKRLFSSWPKEILKERLLFKCYQNGVLSAEVNAAYTSQTCPFCGFVHKDNRKGGKFHCLNCGREGDADYFASLNILSRYKDRDIGIYTPYKKVYEILMGRFNQSVETVQPGLQKFSGRVLTDKVKARRPRTARRAKCLNMVGV